MVIRLLDYHTYCALYLCSLIRGFGEICTIVRGITSQPANAFSNVLSSYFADLQPFCCNLKRGLFDASIV